MKTVMKAGVVLVAISFLASAMVVPAFAAEKKKSFKEASKDAGRAAINYPANVVNESANVVGTAAKGTAGAVVDTVKVTGETLTGDVKKAPEIVTTPVERSTETVRDAAVGTVRNWPGGPNPLVSLEYSAPSPLSTASA